VPRIWIIYEVVGTKSLVLGGFEPKESIEMIGN
jgi:hypothetical protein